MSTLATAAKSWADFGLFSNLSHDFVVPASRVMLAAVLGGIIGLTRERRHQSAGLRTHVIVAIAAASVVAAMSATGTDPNGSSRVVQGVLQGVGFLGAGTILQRHKDEGGVRGLTTAASVWLVAVVGAVAGLGEPILATVTAVVAWIVLVPLKRLESHLNGGSNSSSSD